MIRRSSCLRVVSTLLFFLAAVSGAWAQVNSGSITGIVQDPNKGAVMGATVTATNDRTGEERKATTSPEGLFVIAPLQPSFYTVSVSKDGFASEKASGVQVTVGLEAHLNFTLQLASVSETVTVTTSAAPVDYTSARIGVNVTEREVASLPINGRQVSQLELQAPGATNSGSGNFQDIRFSGQSTEQNAVRYDGVEGSAIIDADPGNLSGETPSPFHLQASLENIQEFRVESNNYPAEYGTGDGGQISVITKSGSNAFHGSAYDYLRNDKFDARNFFDGGASKSQLRLNQFGASLGGPLIKDKFFFFAYYEGYRLRAGTNAIEAAPSSRFGALPDCLAGQSFPSTQCINPAVRQLLPGFHGAPNALLIQPDTTTTLSNSSLDVYQVQGLFQVQEDSGGARFDYHLSNNNSFYVRYFRDQGTNRYPEGITGRNVLITSVPQNGVAALTSVFSSNLVNEIKFGFNEAITNIAGIGPTVNGVDFSKIAINATGSITLSGIAGQGGSNAGLAVPGGLVRANSATNGTGSPYTPYSLSFIDNLSSVHGIHSLKFGTEVRLVRMYTDRLGGTTYSFSNLTSLINGGLSTADDLVDVSQPSPYNNGATGRLHLEQEYYVGYAQDEMKLRPNLTLNVGMRYEYYTPLREANNRYIFFDTATGIMSSPDFCYNPFSSLQSVCLPQKTTWFKSSPNNFLPRVGISWSPFSSRGGFFGSDRTLLRAGFGVYVGPGQTEDQLQPAESDRVWTTPSGGTYCGQAPTCATSTANLTANFLANPNNRAARVRAYDAQYTVPERVYQYSASWQQDWGAGFVSTVAYVGSQGRNLFLRNIANRIVAVRTNTTNGAAIPIRQFDIDCNGVTPVPGTPTASCPATPNANTVLHPYAEIDYKSSGGYDAYNALQTQLLRRFRAGLSLSGQYTFSRSYGDSGGSNEALTTANPYDYNFDRGYTIFDIRHNFNLSALYQLPFARSQHGFVGAVLGNWEIGTIVNARSGLPVPVQITRPDTVFRGLPGTAIAGQIFGSAITNQPGCAICTEAIINTPGGGNSRNVRRPDVVPGVPFFLPNGNLNPAAFATPQPGTFGNLLRNSVKGPHFVQADATVVKRFPIHETKSIEFRAELFNFLNHANFLNPPAQLGNVLPSAVGAANTLQPGQPFTTATRGSFGVLNSTVAQTVGLGTNRQIQFALRLNY